MILFRAVLFHIYISIIITFMNPEARACTSGPESVVLGLTYKSKRNPLFPQQSIIQLLLNLVFDVQIMNQLHAGLWGDDFTAEG